MQKWARFELVFKLVNPLSDDLNRLLRVSEPNVKGNKWNQIKRPIEMHCTGKEAIFKGGEKVKAYQGYSLILQKSKLDNFIFLTQS